MSLAVVGLTVLHSSWQWTIVAGPAALWSASNAVPSSGRAASTSKRFGVTLLPVSLKGPSAVVKVSDRSLKRLIPVSVSDVNTQSRAMLAGSASNATGPCGPVIPS